MKVIDLLNKIANGEEVPKKIKDNAGAILDFKNGHYAGNTLTVLNCVDGMKKLNDEIEIIEEDKLIEKMDEINPDNWCWVAQNKINELIDVVNELKKESDK